MRTLRQLVSFLLSSFMDNRRTVRADGIVAEGPYVDGKRQGQWTERYPDGTVREALYDDGKRQGRWTRYDPDGRGIVVEWSRGEEIGRSSC